MFGKFEQARSLRPDVPRMFIDITPGTPPIYREEMLRRAYSIGYDVAGSLLCLERDRKALGSLDVGEAAREQLFHRNLERFLAG